MLVRLVAGASPVGKLVQAAVLGMYVRSALRDWRDRQAIHRLDFVREFGADVNRLLPMPRQAYVAGTAPRRACQRRIHPVAALSPRDVDRVDRHLTSYIASITGQRVRTSVEVRGFALARLVLPSALGVCDVLSGDVAIFKDTGLFEPHVIAHEFAHRKGYWKELHAQVLAYMALSTCADRVLIQAARCERVYRSLRVLANEDAAAFRSLVEGSGLRAEVQRALLEHRSREDRARTGSTAGAAPLRHPDAPDRSERDLRLRHRLYALSLHI